MKTALLSLLTLSFALPFCAADDYKPALDNFGKSRWTDQVSPDNALPEYPRPMMVRHQWQNLNGLWKFTLSDKDASQPETFDQQILVPYPIEAPLSGIGRMINSYEGRTYMNTRLWYKRTFTIPDDWSKQDILLHFDAVDWEATVYLNGKQIGTHQGGYDAFAFNVTEHLKEGENELVVSVWDPTFKGGYPRGKQIDKQGNIWYKACSGIWQTVWLEPVPSSHIRDFQVTTDIDAGTVTVTPNVTGSTRGLTLHASVMHPNKKSAPLAEAKAKPGESIMLTLKDARLWWPDDPFLYDLKISLKKRRKVIDQVDSYFGMRKTSIAKDEKGIMRMMLNNTFILQNGVLDQGYWPDGNLTPPTDDALKYDVQMTKELGFNLSRKHLKVEPQRWYYWCDKLGLLVWQDMVSTGDAPNHNDTDYATSNEHRDEQFKVELGEMIKERFNHPSIVMWVLFNEGMGLRGKRLKNQSYEIFEDTKELIRSSVDLAYKLDPTRLIDHESGMPMGPNQGRNPIDMGLGHVMDCHSYGTTRCMTPDDKRASVVGEYRGPIEDFVKLVDNPGISGIVYTQISDVENERNGLLTYGREHKKHTKQFAERNKAATSNLMSHK